MNLTTRLEKGTTVHLNGIPVELEEPVLVNTTTGNMPLVFPEQEQSFVGTTECGRGL